MTVKKEKPCGNPLCRRSTGIHGGATFGTGDLDSLGFFSEPCRACAAAFDLLKLEIIFSLMAEATDKEGAENYIRESEWLQFPAWPWPKGAE
jgi:hypothetical protein